jgi:hypothetical protein
VELGKLFERSVDGNLAVFLYTGLWQTSVS